MSAIHTRPPRWTANRVSVTATTVRKSPSFNVTSGLLDALAARKILGRLTSKADSRTGTRGAFAFFIFVT
jgi:hypothetical protein